jgi:hypothetical protein
MHRRCRNASEEHGSGRSCQNSLGQDGTRLGLLLLLVGPNGDGFGGQAFMEHYNGTLYHVNCISDSIAEMFRV